MRARETDEIETGDHGIVRRGVSQTSAGLLALGIPAAKVRPPPPVGTLRDRLIDQIVDGPPGLRLVCGSAGCGKTTVLAHAAATWPSQVVWVSADGTDRGHRRFGHALAAAAGLDPTEFDGDSAEIALRVIGALEARSEPTLVVVDDAHELAGAPPAEALDLLCRYRPRHVTLVVGGRHFRGLDHWRWRAAQDVRELDGDSLRFRLWEVGVLFRDHYESPLRAEELHAITRLTDGWAVALHLIHVATRMLPAAERLRLVTGRPLTARSIRDYLADQVLESVHADHRALLRRVAVLDRIRPERCDRLLGVATAEDLRQLADVGLLLPDADGTSYRLHELLRAQLLAELDEELGHDDVSKLHRTAAEVLEAEGDVVEAVRALGRAGEWDGVRRLLAQDDTPVVPSGPWADGVPRDLRDTDAWVLRATARSQLCEGDLHGARATLAASVDRFREHGGDVRAERDLHLLDGWLQPDPGQHRTWPECLRAALAGETVTRWPDEPAGLMAEGLADLVRGQLNVAKERLSVAAEALSDELGALAELGLCLATLVSDLDGVDAAERALSRARSSGAPILVHLAESLATWAVGGAIDHDLRGTGADEVEERIGDDIQSLLAGLALLHTGRRAAAPLDHAARRFSRVGLRTPAALARAAAVVDVALHEPGSVPDLRAEVAAGRAVGPLPHALTLLADAAVNGNAASARTASSLARQHGFKVLVDRVQSRAASPATSSGREPESHPDGVEVEVRCLGGLYVAVDGVPCDVAQLRPRHQDLLRIMAAHPNRWLHRERLSEWLWPEASMERATRNLQVAISAVRKLIEPDAPAGQPAVIVRNGDTYRLAVDDQQSDLCRLEAALEAAEAAQRADRSGDAARHLARALTEWQGEPVPSAGPVDWAVEVRRHLAHDVAKTAIKIIEALLADGACDRAMDLASRAVEVDPSDDRLWRLAIAAADEAGATAMAADLDRRYRTLVGA